MTHYKGGIYSVHFPACANLSGWFLGSCIIHNIIFLCLGIIFSSDNNASGLCSFSSIQDPEYSSFAARQGLGSEKLAPGPRLLLRVPPTKTSSINTLHKRKHVVYLDKKKNECRIFANMLPLPIGGVTFLVYFHSPHYIINLYKIIGNGNSNKYEYTEDMT